MIMAEVDVGEVLILAYLWLKYPQSYEVHKVLIKFIKPSPNGLAVLLSNLILSIKVFYCIPFLGLIFGKMLL